MGDPVDCPKRGVKKWKMLLIYILQLRKFGVVLIWWYFAKFFLNNEGIFIHWAFDNKLAFRNTVDVENFENLKGFWDSVIQL
jgi:hypothetical protein